MSFSGNISLDNINSILSIKNEAEMSKKISYNIPKISRIFESFQYKISYMQQINQDDTNQIMEALKFVDNLNLFMEESDVKKFKDKMEYIKDNLSKRNWDFKEEIKGQIKYTEMTIINHKKDIYKSMYFNNSKQLSEEIEKELEQVNKTSKFDFKLFKQLQNIFWVVKNVIDDKKKKELENKLNYMKILSKKIKEKYRYDSNPRGGYSMYEDYEYTDYKNYTGNYDYNDNFYSRNDNYYNKQTKYDDSYYDNKYYHSRGGHRKGGFISNMGSSSRMFYSKKQKEEKEVEIPSDPSYYNKNKEEDLKEEKKDNNLYNDSNSNNINIGENNNNINGGNDINSRENINANNNMSNDINNNNYNGGIKEESNSSLDQRINMESNGGNGDNSHINNINANENNFDNVEIITSNANLTQNNSGNYNRKPKKIIIQNKMIAVEVPSSTVDMDNNTNQNSNQNNVNNIRDNNDENNNNGAAIESNINNMENNNNEFNANNNINNNIINKHNGDDNIETRQYNNNIFNKNYKNPYYNNYNNNGYKQNIHNKNSYYNNYYNRYGAQNYSNLNNSNKKYYPKSPNKKIDFVEIDENNNIIQNNTENNNNNPIQNQNESNELVNGQENENSNNITNNKTNELNDINNNQEQNEPNGEVTNEESNQNQNEIKNNINNNLEINKNESNDLNVINNNMEISQQEKENFTQNNPNITNENETNQANGEDKNQNAIPENNNINEDIKETNFMEPNQEENKKEQVDLEENNNIENENIDNEYNINENNSNKDNNKDIENDNENNNYNIDELDEENLDNLDSHEHSEIDEQDMIKYKGEFNKFIIENIGFEPKDYQMNAGNSDEKEDNSENNYNYNEEDLEEMNNYINENENLLGMSPEEKEIELKINDLIQKMDIHQMILDAESELEQENREEQLNKEKAEESNEVANETEAKDTQTNKENNDNNTQNHSNKYIDTVKEMDPQLRNKIKDQLKNNYKLQEILAPKYTFYKNEFFIENSQMFSNELLAYIQKYKTQNFNAVMTLEQFILQYIKFYSKESDILKNYLFYKCKLIEKPEEIWSNMQNFEKKILIPLYQKIIDTRNYRYNSLENIFKNFHKAIYNSIPNSKEVIDKVQKYGSFHNTFMVDIGDTDIDICIVPKISLAEFNTDYLEKLKQGITNAKLGVINNVIYNNSYTLLKIKYSYISSKGKQNGVNIDISVHNILPIFNTHLIRLYGLFDQRFHIMGIYLKYWAKNNNLHGAADGYLSSYALLIMMIHFLQKIVEPKVLPNLQKIPSNNNYSSPVYGEEIYEYDYNDKKIRTNSYYENDVQRIKEYMIKVNEGKVNQETVTNLLVKFFEYYAYFYDSKQKISVHKDLVDSIKDHDDNIAFSIEDPFEITHNPGKSMIKNSENYNKFVKAMKREVNFILGGEYVRRLEIEQSIRSMGSNKKNMA